MKRLLFSILLIYIPLQGNECSSSLNLYNIQLEKVTLYLNKNMTSLAKTEVPELRFYGTKAIVACKDKKLTAKIKQVIKALADSGF